MDVLSQYLLYASICLLDFIHVCVVIYDLRYELWWLAKNLCVHGNIYYALHMYCNKLHVKPLR